MCIDLFICGGSRFRCGGGGGGGEALPWHGALSAPVRQPTNAFFALAV